MWYRIVAGAVVLALVFVLGVLAPPDDGACAQGLVPPRSGPLEDCR